MKLKLSNHYFKTAPDKLDAATKAAYEEFEKYQDTHYKWEELACPCGSNTEASYIISKVDRTSYEYPLCLCSECGLIRGHRYWDETSIIDYYSRWYQKLLSYEALAPKLLYELGAKKSKELHNLLSNHTKGFQRPYTVADIGGASGSILQSFLKEADCFLFDYDESNLEFAKEQGIQADYGGIEALIKRSIEPDVIIYSEVLEHIPDLNRELSNLVKACHKGTIILVTLPGIDSLKEGRRGYDFLEDIHRPHAYYFSQQTLRNLFGRNGFECLYSNSILTALFRFTNKKCPLVNCHSNTVRDLRKAEYSRKYIRPLAIYLQDRLPRSLYDKVKSTYGSLT